MRIVVLGSTAGSLISFRGHLIKTLVKEGHNVVACAPGADPLIVEQLANIGAVYQPIRIDRGGFNPISDIVSLIQLFRVFRRLRPDMVLSYTIKPVIYGAISAKLAGVDRSVSIITGQGYVFQGLGIKGRIAGLVARSLYRAALSCNSTVMFQNPDDRSLFSELGLLRLGCGTTIINGSGVDIDHFAQTPLPREPVFLMIARLLYDKGIMEYITAASIVRKTYPRARFLLAGGIDSNPSSITSEQLKEIISSGDVEYLGVLSDVRPALASASIYVLPSYREGTPRTVLEAMSAGRPIITTNAPGCRETVREGRNGFLVPVKDALSLSYAMVNFIEEPGLVDDFGAYSRFIAIEKYDVRKVTASIISCLGI